VDDIPRLIQEAAAEGIAPRISDCEEFARKSHVLLLRHTTSGTDINISLGLLPFEAEMVARSQPHRIGSLTLRLPPPRISSFSRLSPTARRTCWISRGLRPIIPDWIGREWSTGYGSLPTFWRCLNCGRMSPNCCSAGSCSEGMSPRRCPRGPPRCRLIDRQGRHLQHRGKRTTRMVEGPETPVGGSLPDAGID